MRNKPIWDRNISRPRSYIVGDTSDIIGDRSESAAKLINKLFGTSHRYPEADPPHRGEILPMRNVILPVPKGGKYFSFNHGLWGTGDGQIIYPEEGHVATLRRGEGPYFGAVAVEEGTTNLLVNGDFSNGLSGWNGSSARELIQTPDGPHAQAVRFVTTAGGTIVDQTYSSDTEIEGPITLSWWTYGNKSRGTRYYITCSDNSGTQISHQNYSAPIRTRSWYYYSNTIEPPPSTHRIRLYYNLQSSTGSPESPTEVIVTGFQMERRSFPTSFVNGARAAGRLRYPRDLINLYEGTLAAWVYVGGGFLNSHAYIFDFRDNNGALLLLQRRPEGYLQAYVGPTIFNWDDFPLLPMGWHYVVLTWSTNTARIFIDGEIGTEVSVTPLRTPQNPTFSVGCHPTNNNRYLNTMLSDILVLPYAASPQEILALYEATTLYDYSTPLFIAL